MTPNPYYMLALAFENAQSFFLALWLALDETPGKFADVTFETIRDVAARFGVALTDSQVRKRVKELEALDVLEIAPRRERGRFDLYVYQPSPRRFPTPSPPKPEPATPLFDAAFGKGVESFAPAAVSVFAAVSETETETVAQSIAKPTAPVVADHLREVAKKIQTPTFAEVRVARSALPIPAVLSVAPGPTSREPVAGPLEEINNNKYIKNKTINKPAKDLEAETQAGPEARSVAEVRSLVDFASPKVAAFRRLVARNVWERTIHPDLIDRIVALAVLRVGGTDAKAVESMIRDAKAEVALWNRTDGRRGQPQIWRAITPEVKRLYENAGWVWTPTRFATEPRPEPRRVAEAVEA